MYRVQDAISIPKAIDELNASMSWWSTDSDTEVIAKTKALASAINATRQLNSNITPELQLRAWNVLNKAQTSWAKGGWFTSKATQGKRSEGVQNFNVNKCIEDLKKSLSPQPPSGDFGKVFSSVVPLANDNTMKKYLHVFYRSIEVPTANVGEASKATYKHGSSESRQVFIDAIKNQNVDAVRLLLLDGVTVTSWRFSKGDALELARAEVSNIWLAETVDTDRLEKAWQIVEALVDAGAPLNDSHLHSTGLRHPDSILQQAVVAGRVPLVQKLLNKGAPWMTKHRDMDIYGQNKTTYKETQEIRRDLKRDAGDKDIILSWRKGVASLRPERNSKVLSNDTQVTRALLLVILRAEIAKAEGPEKESYAVRQGQEVISKAKVLLQNPDASEESLEAQLNAILPLSSPSASLGALYPFMEAAAP